MARIICTNSQSVSQRAKDLLVNLGYVETGKSLFEDVLLDQ